MPDGPLQQMVTSLGLHDPRAWTPPSVGGMPNQPPPLTGWRKTADDTMARMFGFGQGVMGLDDPEQTGLTATNAGAFLAAALPIGAGIKGVEALAQKFPRFASAIKAIDSGSYLHGSSADFQALKPGGHGAVYLSNPGLAPSRVTQAEHIAAGPFGGKLYTIKVDESRLKAFDPLNDPEAMRILKAIRPDSPGHWVEYEDMPDVVRAARDHGYNSFRVHEPSVQGESRGITNPDALSISEVEDVRRK